MILIDFKIDEAMLAEDLEEDITKHEECTFVISMFIMPVRMQINGIDLFEYNNDPWSEAPIMNLASNGLLSVKRLKNKKKVTYPIIEGPGDLEFNMIDEINVNIDFFTGSRHVITTSKYDELLEAFQKFAEKVRKFLWVRVPQINDHPYWGPWLRGERD
jgi:hypothetical protein